MDVSLTSAFVILLLMSRAPERWVEWVGTLIAAVAITLAVLLSAERISRLVGNRGLAALDRLMGLVLTAIAVEMLLRGIEGFMHQLGTGSG